jgi:hypothetical protein
MEVVRVKRIALILVVMAMVFFSSGCEIPSQSLSGSGVIIIEQREVTGFNEIAVSTGADLVIKQGEEESLEIIGDDNLLQRIKTEVAGGKLKIYFSDQVFKSMSPSQDIKINISLKELNAISVAGSADIIADDLNTDSLDITISGSADTVLNNLNADTLNITVSGSGDFDISGKVETQTIRISGSGNYRAPELESAECDISISGSGDATVNVSDTLNVSVAGSGDVKYIGDPEIQQSVTGSGSVVKAETNST